MVFFPPPCIATQSCHSCTESQSSGSSVSFSRQAPRFAPPTWDEWQELLSGRAYEKTCPQYPVHCTVPPEAWPPEIAHERDRCPADSP